ncbi:MAG: phosphotransferase [Pseudomonadota bacterium]
MSTQSAPDATPLPDPEALALAADRLSRARIEEAAFAKADLQDVIRHVRNKRIVVRGRLDGHPAVFRIYLGAQAECTRDWTELTRIWPHMNSGCHRVAAPLACALETGVMTIADIPGTPLLQWIYQAKPEDKPRYLQPAARWLRAYTDCSETEAAAAPEGWVKRAERAAKTQAFNRLRRVERPVLAELKRISPLLEGATWRHAVGHGDFHPNNLIADGDRLTGIDCGGSRPAPIYKDMARFLMHMGRRCVIPSGDMYLGVDRLGIDAFADTFALSEIERTLTLPFFLAVEALLRAETRSLPHSRIRRARKMSEALLADLERIGR